MTYVPGQFVPYIVLSPCHKRLFSKMAAQKAWGHDILLTFEWIPLNFIGGSLGISDDLINFWEEFIKNKMADGMHFEKMSAQKVCGRDIL